MPHEPMSGIMGEIEPNMTIAGQIVYLMELYKKRTGRIADTVRLNPTTLADGSLKDSNLSISIRAYQIVPPNILWVGEAR